MGVYLYPNNTETELKNAYIGIPNPTSIVLDKSSISLTTVGQTEQLTATIEPTISDHSITWSSDDTTVATVDTTGLVTCVTPGTCTITATTVNGLTATCGVTDQGWQPGANNIVYFPLEDDLNDYTGNYTLTTYNSAQIGTVGGVKCLDCTSSSAWASCSISTLPQGGATRTEMCWVKWTVSGSGEQPIWSYGQGSFNKLDCALRDGGIFWTQYGSGTYPSPTYQPTIGDWYHYAITVNGSSEQKLYVNGVLIGTSSATVNTNGTNLYFSHQQRGNNYGKNCISKFIIESTIRTAQEIADYYDLTKSLYGIS